MIDTHLHLDLLESVDDIHARLSEAVAVGVTDVIGIGVDPRVSSMATRALPSGLRVHYALGFHPQALTTHDALPASLALLRERIASERPVAIGETGLDARPGMPTPALQHAAFCAQLALSQELDLPVVLHGVRRDADMLRVLDEALARGPLRGVWHGFSGSKDTMLLAVKRGFHIGVGFIVTHANARRIKDAVPHIALDRLLVETDAPPFAPARLADVVHTIAQLRGVDDDVIARATTNNARALFGLSTPASPQ